MPSLLLDVRDLHVTVEGKEILHGVSLAVRPGEVHAVMGPNGSGKSTFVNALMGHPKLTITKGRVLFQGRDLLTLTSDERARLGLFLAFQYPKEIAGVSLRSFLFAASKAQRAARHPKEKAMSPIAFKAFLEGAMRELKMDAAFAERSVNQGFSGGEKKKAEILQLRVLQPRLALLDETDSGLDIDALKVVAAGVNSMRGSAAAKRSEAGFSAIVVTHYARILEHLQPDRVHVMVEGRIVESGGADLAERLEEEGYTGFEVQEGPLRSHHSRKSLSLDVSMRKR